MSTFVKSEEVGDQNEVLHQRSNLAKNEVSLSDDDDDELPPPPPHQISTSSSNHHQPPQMPSSSSKQSLRLPTGTAPSKQGRFYTRVNDAVLIAGGEDADDDDADQVNNSDDQTDGVASYSKKCIVVSSQQFLLKHDLAALRKMFFDLFSPIKNLHV